MAQCTATNRQGDQCGQVATRGATVCRFHGSGAPQVKAAAAERLAEADARKALSTLDTLLGPAEAIENPLQRLQELAGEADRWRDLMARRVAELTSVGYESALGLEQVKAEVVLYTGAIDRLANILTAIARLDIDSRLVAIAEAQAATVLAAVEAGIEHIGLSREDRQGIRAVVASRLRGEQKPARRPEPLNLAERITALEHENAELRRAVAEQQATRQPRLAIEAPRPPVPLSALVVDSPDSPDSSDGGSAANGSDRAATEPHSGAAFNPRAVPRSLRGHPALRPRW